MGGKVWGRGGRYSPDTSHWKAHLWLPRKGSTAALQETALTAPRPHWPQATHTGTEIASF